ncbi:NAD(P)-dependent oxidoreductase [Helicobacter sp. XJK30-2]|uniref:NAD(P)-dependent oxidoreductase n=1 Tax=Helicobacter zhangjianzhongii TaxID=2974574 RepID=A0ACC6FQV0_9HELI|nr:NAD(P)-dependent oxidoreductase [Helicobacter sp. XJK30-2]MDL0081293.1 NAD(P)-dependent oxidoreductase [Helicobacter sp. XJK30-2]
MHLLITGGAGFIGRALQEFLQTRYSYKLYTPSSSELDLRDCHAVSSYIKAHKISHIIHLANRGGGRDTMGLHDIAEYNLRMFFAIMSQANRVEKILHFGSGAEYSKHKPIISASEPSYLESLPLDSYGFYKGVCSRFIESTRGNVICLRIFGCYGAGENYRYKFISNAIVKNLLHLPITIYKDCIFDYIYIDDLLRIIDHFLHASIASLDHRVYNASSGRGILLSELAKIINATSPYKSPIHFIESGLNNQYTSDNSRLLSAMPALKLTPHSHAIESMREYFASNLTSLDVESIKADPYLSRIGEMWAAASNGGGGVNI